jgi:hypothetical protein
MRIRFVHPIGSQRSRRGTDGHRHVTHARRGPAGLIVGLGCPWTAYADGEGKPEAPPAAAPAEEESPSIANSILGAPVECFFFLARVFAD